jgi:hypothetical protein
LDILEIVEKSDVSSVYISIDAPANASVEVLTANRLVTQVAKQYCKTSNKEVHLNIRKRNVGCSAAVLSSCDWFFRNENFGVILEDDCLPSTDFFNFATEHKELLYSHSDIWLLSGSQFAPSDISGRTGSISSYAFIWGWATCKEKWLEIRSYLFEDLNLQRKSALGSNSVIESIYWYSGYRRAMNGFVDAWDTPLLYLMYRFGKKAILPPVNLVTNVGDDSVAVHTRKKNPLLRFPLANLKSSNLSAIDNQKLDKWIKLNVYGISFRHIFTNQLTLLIDLCLKSRKKFKPLSVRFHDAEIK